MSEMNETNQRADAGPNTERESYGAHAIRRASEAAQKALAVIEEGCCGTSGMVIVQSPASCQSSAGAIIAAWTGSQDTAAGLMDGLGKALKAEMEGGF
jgi:hypothetical protein